MARCKLTTKMSSFRFLLLFAFLVCPPLFAADVDSAVAELEAHLDRLARQKEVAGMAVAVAHGGEIVFSGTWGVREAGSAEPIDRHTRFRVASLSKGFASTVSAVLVEKGLLDWSDRVAPYNPHFRLKSNDQTVRVNLEHVLSHRVGLPSNAYDNLLEADWDVNRILARYREVKAACEVGSCYGYQNVVYNLSEDLIERKLGEPFEAVVFHQIFQPLGMHSANYGLDGLRIDDNWARPHVRTRGGVRPVEVQPNYYRVPAAAGVNASLADMEQWLLAHMGHRPEVLSNSVLQMLREKRVVTHRERRAGWRHDRLRSAHYGLGFRVYDYAGHPMIYHAGAVQGYRAQIAIFPEEDVGMLILWNSEGQKGWGTVPVFADALYDLRYMDWMKLQKGRGRSLAGR